MAAQESEGCHGGRVVGASLRCLPQNGGHRSTGYRHCRFFARWTRCPHTPIARPWSRPSRMDIFVWSVPAMPVRSPPSSSTIARRPATGPWAKATRYAWTDSPAVAEPAGPQVRRTVALAFGQGHGRCSRVARSVGMPGAGAEPKARGSRARGRGSFPAAGRARDDHADEGRASRSGRRTFGTADHSRTGIRRLRRSTTRPATD